MSASEVVLGRCEVLYSNVMSGGTRGKSQDWDRLQYCTALLCSAVHTYGHVGRGYQAAKCTNAFYTVRNEDFLL